MSINVSQSLTPAQCEAVDHVDGPLLVLAGPGSGKTRVVTHRVARLIARDIPARQILALTFTNKAAEEMLARLARLAPGEAVWVGTFHRFCARLLRQHARHVGLNENYTIYDADDSRRVVKQTLEQLGRELTLTTPETVAQAISWAKNNLITAQQYRGERGNLLGAVVADVYPAYQRRLIASNAADFDDLLLYVATLLRENPSLRETLDQQYRYILVDEYQDTNLAQYAIVRALSIDHPNLAVTGDPDQSIYGWRGANLTNILEFEKDFPNVRVVRLEQNYRSTKNILRVAHELISHNVRRKKKTLYTENESGRPVRLVCYPTHKDEAESIAAWIAHHERGGRRGPRDFAVFYRVNALSRSVEDALRVQGVPYQIVNGVEFFQRQEIKDVIAYLQVLNNPRDDVALMRVINTPPRGIGRVTVGRLGDHARQRGLSMLEAAREAGTIESLKSRAALAVARFVVIYDRLSEVAHAAIEEILGHVLDVSGYQEHLRHSQSEEDQDRLANIQELLTVAREFDLQHPADNRLEAFLEQTALVNDTDAWEEEDDRVTLMTLHAAKGLEFPVVFIIATEEGILPHERSREDDVQLEEERRLLFVGITRAEAELHLSMALNRDFHGARRRTIPSSFLMELPRETMELIESGMPATDAPSDDPGDVQESPESYEPAWVDEQFIPEHPAPPARPASPDPPAPPARLITAADMLANSQPTASSHTVSPDVFHQGMAVTHPEHGLGKIVALSGDGAQRRATVNFALAGQVKLVLANSVLRPAIDHPVAPSPPTPRPWKE